MSKPPSDIKILFSLDEVIMIHEAMLRDVRRSTSKKNNRKRMTIVEKIAFSLGFIKKRKYS